LYQVYVAADTTNLLLSTVFLLQVLVLAKLDIVSGYTRGAIMRKSTHMELIIQIITQ